MKEYYEVLLKEQNTQYDLMSVGTIVKATELVNAATRAADKDTLTLQDVCDMTDKLDTMLASIAKLKKDIDFTVNKLAEFDEKKETANA